MKDRQLDQEIAIITGGAGFLGSHYAQTFAREGAHLVLADVDKKRAIALAKEIETEFDTHAIAIETDVGDPDSVNAMVERIADQFNRIDILVNNAALDPKFDKVHQGEYSQRFEDLPFQEWQDSLSVNITGMFLCAQAVVPLMRSQQSGVIVNVSSTYGLVGPDQSLYQIEGKPAQYKPVTYSVTKAAVLGLTRYLASYLRGTGIRVNTLTPGGVYLDHDEQFVARYSAKTLLGRMATPEEISRALLFLVSDGSTYMTGANLVVDGGWTAW